MRNIATYILVIIAILCSGCTRDEFNTTPEKVDFAVRYTSFKTYDVSSIGTKAQPNANEPTELEKKIVSAYFLVFNGDGEDAAVVECRTITPNADNTIPSQSVYNLSGLNNKFAVCYLANVKEDFVKNIRKISDLKTAQYDITYAPFDVVNNTWGIPLLNGEHCFPMFGMSTYDGSTNVVEVPFERLFAKVYVQLTLDLASSTWENLTVPPYFRLDKYDIVNLPTKLVLAKSVDAGNVIDGCESEWCNREDSFQSYFNTLDEPVSIFEKDAIGNNRVKVYELTLYVPEYALIPSSTGNDNQLVKPEYKPDGKYPLHMKFKGVIHQPDYEDSEFKYTIYLGHNATNSFSFCRNTQYNNILTINGVNNAILGSDKRVEYSGHNLADPDNDGTDDPANCYIISKAGRYIIPTYKGNLVKLNEDYNGTLGGIIDGKTEEFTDGNNIISNIKFIEASNKDEKNYIIFDVNLYDKAGTTFNRTDIADGNTVLVFKDKDDKVVWSWHLWFVSPALLTSLSDQTYNTGFDMMDRNLGAKEASNTGVYYKWGDKDPYFETKTDSGVKSDYYGSTDAGSWEGDKKSVTDPCPPGYKIPSNNVWSNSPNSLTNWGASFFTYEGSPLVIYPYSNYIGDDGNLKIEEDKVIRAPAVATRKMVVVEIKLNHRVIQRIKRGALWSTAQKATEYVSYTKDVEILSGSQYRFGIELGSLVLWDKWQNLQADNDLFKEDWVQSFIGSLADGVSVPEDTYSNNITYPVNYGLQVRCVRIGTEPEINN